MAYRPLANGAAAASSPSSSAAVNDCPLAWKMRPVLDPAELADAAVGRHQQRLRIGIGDTRTRLQRTGEEGIEGRVGARIRLRGLAQVHAEAAHHRVDQPLLQSGPRRIGQAPRQRGQQPVRAARRSGGWSGSWGGGLGQGLQVGGDRRGIRTAGGSARPGGPAGRAPRSRRSGPCCSRSGSRRSACPAPSGTRSPARWRSAPARARRRWRRWCPYGRHGRTRPAAAGCRAAGRPRRTARAGAACPAASPIASARAPGRPGWSGTRPGRR